MCIFEASRWLWFDVGIKRYTTLRRDWNRPRVLWFDVGIKRYTTSILVKGERASCGLM